MSLNRNARNVSIDIEANGPCPGIHSMISIGAVIVENGLQRRFYAEIKPVTDVYIPSALAVSGFTHEQTMKFRDPYDVMYDFKLWLDANIEGRPILWADNPMFDGGFINYYFWRFLGANPFGWSAAGIGQLYKGLVCDTHAKFTHLRTVNHTHNALDDALGNAGALLQIFKAMDNAKASAPRL